jgi:mRNA-degrading endonuclease toxin of MazEF toxin-antitoxin module
MWSDPEAAGGFATTSPELRRGHVWLVQTPPVRRQRAVLLLSRDRDGGADEPLLAAPLVRGAVARGRVAVEIPSGFEDAVIDVRRLLTIDRSALLQPIARLPAPRLAEVDQALCDVLGLDVLAWPSADDLERRLAASRDLHEPEAEAATAAADPVLDVPAVTDVLIHNGDGPRATPIQEPPAFPQAAPFVQATTLDELGLAPPPAPPPLFDFTAPAAESAAEPEHAETSLDEHPIAQIFGRPRPTPSPSASSSALSSSSPSASPLTFTNAGARATPAAAVMRELFGVVQRRLHRSAPRLEAVLSQAGEEGRSVEWAAAAVRHASVRGVTQSTLDEIAAEIAAVGARSKPDS